MLKNLFSIICLSALLVNSLHATTRVFDQPITAPNLSGTNTGDETTATIKTKLGAASVSTDGYLIQSDFAAFLSKQDALGYTPVPVTRTINGYPLTGNISLTAVDIGLANVANIKNNFTAIAAPTATDDSTKGYTIGSQWIYGSSLYVCTAATPSAAVWITPGAVSSVFSRTGAITAQSGDYSAAQISGLGTAATLDVGTSAGNIVRLDPTTAKLPAVDGSLLTNIVAPSNATQLQSVNISTTAPANGQQLVYNSTSAAYEPTTPAGGGDVVGPSSSTNSNFAAFDGTTGKAIKDSTYSAASFVPVARTVNGHALSGDINVTASDVGNGTAQWNASQIQSRAVASTAPTDGQAIVWDNANSTWKPGTVAAGGTAVPTWYWPANAFPQDWKESVWTNVGSARPTIDYDQLSVPVWRVDYSLKEGMGIFLLDAIPADTTNIVITITAKPYATAAGVMAWKADYVRYRSATAPTAIATAQLGSTTLNATGITHGSYTVALSTLGATTGDQLAFVIYPDTSVSGRSATDWLVLSISIKVN